MAMAAASLALLAAGLAASSGLAAPDGGLDTVPPDFAGVPACHIEAVPPDPANKRTVHCPGPSVTGSSRLALALPDEMYGGPDRAQWRDGDRFLWDVPGIWLRPGTYKGTWTSTDPSGNTATTTQVILISDTTPPLFKPAPAPAMNVEATAPETEISASLAGIAVVDASGSASLKSNVGTIGVGETARMLWTARDDAGNVSRVRQEITVQDTTPPRVELPSPPAITIEATGTLTTITPAMAGVRGVDAVTPKPALTASPSRLGIGSHTVEWIARDGAGLDSPAVGQPVTIVPKFALTSSSISDYGINLVFSQDVDPKTAAGIRAAKLDAPRVIDARPAISVSEKTIRIDPKRDPTFPSPGFHRDTFCEPRGITYDCYKINGQWIITLPGSLASVHGFSLHGESQPSFEACRAQIGTSTAVAGCHTPVLAS